MKKARLHSNLVDASSYGSVNPPPKSGLFCPTCEKEVYWRPKTAIRVAHFAHLATIGNCVDPDGLRRPRAVFVPPLQQISDDVVLRLGFEDRIARRPYNESHLDRADTPANDMPPPHPGLKRVIVRNAQDAADQEAHVQASPDVEAAGENVRIEIDGTSFPWSSFYFDKNDYADIWALNEQDQLPPAIAIVVRRDNSSKTLQSNERIVCVPLDDRANGLRFKTVVLNEAGVEPNLLNGRTIALGIPTVTRKSGNDWLFVTIEIRILAANHFAPAP